MTALCPHCQQPLEQEVCTTCEPQLKEETESRTYYKRLWRATPAYGTQEEQER